MPAATDGFYAYNSSQMAGRADEHAIESLENGPGDVALESETGEKTVLVKLLAVDHAAAHGRFALHWNNVCFFAKLLRQKSDASQTQLSFVEEAFRELFKLLEQYAPVWYTEEHHNQAVAALRVLQEPRPLTMEAARSQKAG